MIERRLHEWKNAGWLKEGIQFSNFNKIGWKKVGWLKESLMI